MYFFLLFLSGIVLFYVFLFFPVTSVFASFFSSLLLVRNKRYLAVLALILGFAYAFFRYVPPLDPSLLGKKEVVLDCVADALSRETSSGRYTNRIDVVSAVDVATGKEIVALRSREMNILSGEPLKQGWKYQIAARSGEVWERLNPGMMITDEQFLYVDEVRKREIADGNPVSAWLRERREDLHKYLKGKFDPDTAALLSSITVGETSGMSEELRRAFSTTGLAHLLSISGTHFGLFSMLVFGMFRLLIRSIPYRFLNRVTMYVAPSQAAAIFSLPFVLMYLFISGAGVPALRSFIMVDVFLLGVLIGRKGLWLNSLLFAAFLICLWDPSSITNVSFQLSFLAVFFIGFFVFKKRGGKADDDGQTKGRRILKVIIGSLVISLSASLGIAPLVAYYFHYFSIISPLANVIVTPFIGFVLVPLSLVSAFTFMFTGHYPFQTLVALASGAAIKGVDLLSAVPYADIKIPGFSPLVIVAFYAGLVLYFESGERRPVLLIPMASLAVCLFPFIPFNRDMSVTFLDVGQGDSAVVETYHGKTVAIDTGRTGKELDGYLRYLGRKTIDALIVTHADDDHAAGVPYIMKRFGVKELWDNGLLIYPDGIPEQVIHRSLERGDEITADGLVLYVLHPYKGFYTFADTEAAAENNDSLVMKIVGTRRSFIFTADAAEEAEEDMLYLGAWLKSDVIKVAHHGSRTSSTESFIRAVSPAIGVISVGRDNPYGHPHAETLERLSGIKIYRTDRDGAIKISETGSAAAGGLKVKTFREYRLKRTVSLSGEWSNIKRLFMRW
jgi:competence protein ComEC